MTNFVGPMSETQTHPHTYWMQRALELAQRGGRAVHPNPQVGAVVVSADGSVLGEGWHRVFGGPHAEVHALEGSQDLSAATLYVTLEPCSHHGKTPPCADLIIKQGVGRVVVGSPDPNPLVSGAGIQKLRDAGVSVEVGVLEEACRALNPGFMTRMDLGRPWVSAKIAQSLDGYVAPRIGTSQWITGHAARVRVHQMRADADAVLTGTGTVLADDPSLTVRHVQGPQPVRVVLDRRGVIPASARLFSDGGVTWVVTGPRAVPAGGEVIRVDETTPGADQEASDASTPATGFLDLSSVLHVLSNRGVGILMVEAGPTLTSALLAQDLVDELRIFSAPVLMGGGKPSFLDPARETLDQALRPIRVRYEEVAPDLLITLTLREV